VQWAASLEARFPAHSKFFALDVDPGATSLMRHLLSLTPRPLSWRGHASYVLTHSYTYTPAPPGSAAASAPLVHAADDAPAAAGAAATDDSCGVLVVRGYVRGLPLSIDRAVHVPGVGDVLPDDITVLPDPTPLRAAHGNSADGMAVEDGAAEAGAAAAEAGAAVAGGALSDGGSGVALVSSGTRMVLRYEADADGTLGGEQTWPTAHELREAEEAAAAARDDDDDDDDDDEPMVAVGGAGGSSAMVDDDEEEDEEDEQEEIAPLPLVEEDGDELDGMGEGDEMNEAEARREWLERRAAREDDAKFPDEVDTPLDQPARERFARFRGLKSWRSSPWHPKENLPPEYGRVFHFQHCAALQRYALREQAAVAEEHPDSVAPAGSYVSITLRVPHAFAERHGMSGGLRIEGAPAPSTLVLCGVNTYEAHLSVLHFTLTLSGPAEAAELTVKSKQPLTFQCGFRTFSAQPIFSDDSRRADKHKLERFVHPKQQLIASVYGPALYAPAPVLAFLPSDDPAQSRLATAAATTNSVTPEALAAAAAEPTTDTLAVPPPAALPLSGLPVGYGTLAAVDADRIILKKILLTVSQAPPAQPLLLTAAQPLSRALSPITQMNILLTLSSRAAPHRTTPTARPRIAPHRIAPHRTAPHRTAPHRSTLSARGCACASSGHALPLPQEEGRRALDVLWARGRALVQARRAAHQDGAQGRHPRVARHARLHEVPLRRADLPARHRVHVAVQAHLPQVGHLHLPRVGAPRGVQDGWPRLKACM
jgi:hypothetical protein